MWHFVLAGLLLMAATLGASARTDDAPKNDARWVGTWAAAQQLAEPQNLPPGPGLSGSTLRQIVHVSLGGKRVRLRFSNEFGNGVLTLRAAHIAPSAGRGAIRPERDKTLLFHGLRTVTIPPGALVLSDPLDFDLAPLSDLAVTVQFADVPRDVTGHPGSRTTSYRMAGDTNLAAPFVPATAQAVVHWYVLCGVDVVAATEKSAAVVILGDSITDGRGVTTDANRRWPDNLARRLQANGSTKNVAVLNQGIGGNRVLNPGLGPSALARFDRDVIAQSGVRYLVILEGINDIGTSAGDPNGTTAQALVAAYEQMVVRAHAHDIKVYGATLLPIGQSFYDTPVNEAARQTVNTWIRTSGVFDGVIDMEAAMRDPQHPLRLKAIADSGDHLHPNDEGYRIMAEAIDLALFTR